MLCVAKQEQILTMHRSGAERDEISATIHVSRDTVAKTIARGFVWKPKQQQKKPKVPSPYALYGSKAKKSWCNDCGCMVPKPCLVCYLRSIGKNK